MTNIENRDDQLELGFEAKPAGSSARIPEDQAQRLIIRTQYDKNLMVLAGAGAGKTYELVERMVGLLADLDEAGEPTTRIRNIAAITFTRKAAGELRTRFYDRLQTESENQNSSSHHRLREAADRIDQCFIGTIHAFCSRLLRERPLEAGLPFDFKELDERDEPRARRQAWTQFTNERLKHGDDRLRRLLEIGFSAEDLYEFFTRRNEFPELELKPTDTPEPDLKAATDEAIELVTRSIDLLKPEARQKAVKWEKAILLASEFLSKRTLDSNADRAAFLRIFDSKSLDSKGVAVTKYFDKEVSYALRDELVPKFKRDFVDPGLRLWKQHIFSLMAGFVDEAAAFYEERRRQSGVVTFGDLLVKTAALLRTHPEVRRYFKRRYKKILVDEFQDTDPVQAEILFYLTGSDSEEQDWRSLNPEPGSLFVVGDEKQSIYRFRRADVDTFRFVRDRIAASGGEVISLNTSFRSLGNLCGWLNETFQQIFETEDPTYQAPHGNLLPYRPAGADAVCVRRLVVEEPPGGREALVCLEAERIADFIAAARIGQTPYSGESASALLPQKPFYGDFMILTWYKKYVDHYAQALEARGIAYDLVGGGDLGNSEELGVITQMLEAVIDPHNPVPLIGYLRGLLVGFGDDELFKIKQTCGKFDWNIKEYGLLPDVLSERLNRAYSRLRNVRRQLTTMTPAAAFEQLIDDAGLVPWAAASRDYKGSSRAGNLYRLMANVRRWERQGLHWVDIVHEMRALAEEPDYQIPGLTLESGERDAVRIMNLHQAKGLQAKVVILADAMSSGYDGPPDFHVSRMGDKPYLSMAVQVKRGWGWKTAAEPEGWEEDEQEEARYLKAEETRLRYVAATRARNLLIVSVAETKRKKRKTPWGAFSERLASVPQLEEYPRAAAPALRAESTIYQGEDSARAEGWSAVAKPSWNVETASVEGEDHLLFLSGDRRGADYGSAVHKLLEEVVSDRVSDPETYLRVSTTLDPDSRSAALSVVDGFRRSDIWTGLKASSEWYAEAPFGTSRERAGKTLLRGRIDLVYRVPGGWKIVDYKTDAVTSDQEAAQLVEHYRTQVEAYASHWTNITGEPVIEKGLWLTALNRFVRVD